MQTKSKEALQIAEERREAKGKGEKERHTHLNAEFQRIAKRDQKAFLGDQCNKIQENKRMGKTRDLVKKIRYQGNISCKDGLNKGQKWSGPERSRRYKKDGVITPLEPDTLECKVKWAIGSMTMNKASLVEVMEFQLSYFKS